jgi:hypothetical protein
MAARHDQILANADARFDPIMVSAVSRLLAMLPLGVPVGRFAFGPQARRRPFWHVHPDKEQANFY